MLTHIKPHTRIRCPQSGFVTLSLMLSILLSSAGYAAEVKIGTSSATSDVGFFIAQKKKYFDEEGISVTFVPFDTGSKMIAPLGTGQLDVGGAAPSSALYNAVARGIDIKIVADKGSTPPGHGFQPLLVRKDLYDSGKVKDFKDLKGLKIAAGGVGISTSVTLEEVLKKGGLTSKDVSTVTLGYPQHVVALQNSAVDASLTVEPFASMAIASGAAIRLAGDDEIYPYHQLASVFYSGEFIKHRPQVAKGFMRAYIRAVRDYNDALKDGRLTGPNADAIIAILIEYTPIKDAALLRSIVAHGTNPDARMNIDSLRKDLDYFKEQGLIHGEVTIEKAINTSIVESALAELGPYIKREN